MKHLMLMRHAEARLKQAGETDRDRPLTAQGQNQAYSAGLFLQMRTHPIDQVLCSDARRTRETLAGLGASGDDGVLPDPVFVPDLYAVYDCAELAACIRAHARDDATRVLVIGHNPVLHQMVGWLAAPATDIGDLAYRYDPATIAVFDLMVGGWADLRPGCGQLADSFIPSSAST